MGRDIPAFPIDDKFLEGAPHLSTYPPSIQNLVASLKSLHSQELRLFFYALFQTMSPSSKQAVSEIIWMGLSPNERQLSEMPFNRGRWSQYNIDAALRTAFTSSQSPTSGNESETSPLSAQGALVPRRRFLSDMIELDMQIRPREPYYPGMGSAIGTSDNLTLRDIVTGIIANTVSRRGVNVYSFESQYPSNSDPSGSGANQPPPNEF